MAITAGEKYLLNKMNSVASKVQLGTLIENAETVSAGEVALAEGKVFIGNASNVATATTLTSGQIVVGNGSSVAAAVSVTGDVTLSNAGVTAIASGVIVNADVNASAAIDFSKLAALSSGNILVGNGSNVAASVAVTGDISLSNAGVAAIASGVIVNADVNASAAIDFSKLATLSSGNILVGSAGNVATSVAVSGDISISNTGVAAITAGSIVQTDFNTDDSVKHTTRYGVGYTDLNSAGTGVAFAQGPTIPDKAVITKVWFHIKTTFAGNGDDGSTISVGLNTNTDLKAATAISDGTTWDAGFKDGVQVNTVATYLALTAARTLKVVWTAAGTDTALTAGSMYVFVEWVLSN